MGDMKQIPAILSVDIDTTELDVALEKANHLVKVLEESKQLISSLAFQQPLSDKEVT